MVEGQIDERGYGRTRILTQFRQPLCRKQLRLQILTLQILGESRHGSRAGVQPIDQSKKYDEKAESAKIQPDLSLAHVVRFLRAQGRSPAKAPKESPGVKHLNNGIANGLVNVATRSPN